MDSYVSLWNPMGYYWIPMDSYIFLWIPMHSYKFLRIPMDSYRIPMDSFTFLWIHVLLRARQKNPVKRPGSLPGPSRKLSGLGPSEVLCISVFLLSLLVSRISIDSYGFPCILQDSYRIPMDS